MRAYPPAEERYAAAWREDVSGCWIWTASVTQGRRGGYAQMEVDGRRVKVHRWAYERFVGPVPAGLELDHICRVRRCVRPDHLEPVTHSENVRRGWAQRKG